MPSAFFAGFSSEDNHCRRPLLLPGRRLSTSALDEYRHSPPAASCNHNNNTRRRHHRRNTFSSASFHYHRLPDHHLLNLSVLKLDGSSFEIQVARSASVSNLKLAVERVFDHSPDQRQPYISWSHVWGHFCLCYDHHKLTYDKASLCNFGIKDGDQLHFIRHLSMNYSPPKRRLKGHGSVPKKHGMSLLESKVLQELLQNGKEVEHENNGGCSNECFHSGNDDSEDVLGHGEFSLAHFLRGWLSHTRLLGTTGRMRLERSAWTSRFGSHCQRIGTKVPL